MTRPDCPKLLPTAALGGLMLLLVGSMAGAADLKPHPLFTDGAVLQQGKIVPVWGSAKPGETVTVKIGEDQATTKANDDGRWKVELPAMKAGGPHELTIKCEDDSVTIKDVLIGEVWICSGQSNMGFGLGQARNGADEVKNANHPEIRFFNVRQKVTY